MRYLGLMLVASFAVSCGKVDPEKIDTRGNPGSDIVSKEDLSGTVGPFAGTWKGTADGEIIKEQGTAQVTITIDQDVNALTVKFQGALQAGAPYSYDFGKMAINQNELLGIGSSTTDGRIGKRGISLHDAKGATLVLKREGKTSHFQFTSYERQASGQYVRYNFAGTVGI